MVVVACSATESVRGSSAIKNGFIALRYLKLGNDVILDSEVTTSAGVKSNDDATVLNIKAAF